MPVPHSTGHERGHTAVLIPLRSLRNGKLRLAEHIDADARAELIESMASTVLAAAHDLDVLIVHDDPAVEEWATARGAMALRPTEPGLNHAVTVGRDHLRGLGFSRVIIAHADLPRAHDLRVADIEAPVAIVPDRHGDGTNVLAVDTALDFTFAYGPGSCANHVEIARRLGTEPFILDAPDLAWDVDHPDDLTSSPKDPNHVDQEPSCS